MKKISRPTGKVATVAAAPIAILVAAGLIWNSSYAAFSSTTRNSGNNWATGTVALSDDDTGSARFQVSNMLPGQTETKCIAVTANASVPGVVKGYAINPVTSPQGLENYIKITLDYGTGGSFGSCTGFTATGNSFTDQPLSAIFEANSYALSAESWVVPAGTTVRTYRVTWTFDTTGLSQSALDGLQGTHTGLDFQWELQNS